ncbi:hypothetical protein KORDIASMS9_00452 [Kordia sp. SMS9]|uniref:hypothetical protein n=1 Tax=Kordia sp. SMS9 TaxID=2282170 RepID=UPI000E0CCAB8|nr:hypothetical protein [Kordia sp. SMS9]AXG68259.1 hypothetical protein KORDIASMS9_00452 [Kordia sp. SMS9]
MKKKYILLPIILLSILPLFSQKQTAEAAYASYFELPRESLYLHLNKTTYFQGEEIWFKGYAYDQKNQLSSKATTNINVGIYDAQGNQIKKALYAAKDGVTNGNFLIDSTFTAGTYYIKADTNWMKNFKENDAFVQKIEIVTNESINEKKVTEKARFDFQFLPEGGHIVANTTNNIGFKIIANDGKGVTASGVVYDEEKNQVASFESNTLGMGKFLFQPKKEIQYTAEITLENNAILTKLLPQAKAQGISLILQSLTENDIILDFSTNEETLKNNPNKKYKILIHQHGKLKTVALQFDELQKAIRIPKVELFKGINTITVFDNDQNPILERLFFNDVGIKKANIHVSKLNTIQDSILLSVKAFNLNENANVSISVLPETTESYQPQHNMLSNLYLKPHLRGVIENPQYYFQKMDRKKKYELDILLLTQGWSRYEWKNIFETKPIARHPFENGITISGRVNVPKKGIKQLFFHTTKNHSAQFIDLDEDQKFEISGLFLEKDEEVRFSYLDTKNVFKKPSMYLRFIAKNPTDKISEAFLNTTKHISTSADFTIPKDFFTEKAEALDTIVLQAENPKYTFLDEFMADAEITDVTEETYYMYYNIVQFLNFNGFTATEGGGSVSISHRASKRPKPSVFLNNFRIRDPGLHILYNMSLANIERIEIDRYNIIPFNGGRSDGIIKIYTRERSMFAQTAKDYIYIAAKTTKSFTKGKTYYAPNYASYLHPVFQKYGTISWLPTVQLNTETPTSFKIYDTYTKNVTLFIEGISESGHLISAQKTIKVR